MRIVVIGGSGHIGSFLVPRLVRAGHEVVNLTRGSSRPYVDAPEWAAVRQVTADRQALDEAGTFGERVLAEAPDAVVDLVCFTLPSADALVAALRGRVGHLVSCGSVWSAGPATVLPVTEANANPPVGEYGIAKRAIARMLAAETAGGGLVTTTVHPGHISGPGWIPIGPTGNLDLGVWATLAAGEPLLVPGLGAETMAHVHADDVAQAFELALARPQAAAGREFFVTAADALNVRGYAALGASWFGREADLRHVGWDEFRAATTPEHGEASWEHLMRSQVASIDAAREALGYAPRYTAAQTVHDAVRALVTTGALAGRVSGWAA